MNSMLLYKGYNDGRYFVELPMVGAGANYYFIVKNLLTGQSTQALLVLASIGNLTTRRVGEATVPIYVADIDIRTVGPPLTSADTGHLQHDGVTWSYSAPQSPQAVCSISSG